jgi:hypothetical protein
MDWSYGLIQGYTCEIVHRFYVVFWGVTVILDIALLQISRPGSVWLNFRFSLRSQMQDAQCSSISDQNSGWLHVYSLSIILKLELEQDPRPVVHPLLPRTFAAQVFASPCFVRVDVWPIGHRVMCSRSINAWSDGRSNVAKYRYWKYPQAVILGTHFI